MELNEWEQLAARLLAAFPNQNTSAETLAIYYDRLNYYQAEQVADAVGRCIDDCKFFPTVAELMERLGYRRKTAQELEQEAEYARYRESNAAALPPRIPMTEEQIRERKEQAQKLIAAAANSMPSMPRVVEPVRRQSGKEPLPVGAMTCPRCQPGRPCVNVEAEERRLAKAMRAIRERRERANR